MTRGSKRLCITLDESDEEVETVAPIKPVKIHKNVEGNVQNLIFSKNNDVYFYTGVTTESIIQLQKEVTKVVEALDHQLHMVHILGLKTFMNPINLHINSPGGSIFACFSFIDFMTQIKKKYPDVSFHSIVEGRAASAGTLISVVCDQRSITEYGFMLIHQLSSGTWGNYNSIKDEVKNLDLFMDKIRLIYRKHTKVPQNEVDEILKHDLYWDSQKCLDYGLVDKIIV